MILCLRSYSCVIVQRMSKIDYSDLDHETLDRNEESSIFCISVFTSNMSTSNLTTLFVRRHLRKRTLFVTGQITATYSLIHTRTPKKCLFLDGNGNVGIVRNPLTTWLRGHRRSMRVFFRLYPRYTGFFEMSLTT